MVAEVGSGEIASYKNEAAGESSRNGAQGSTGKSSGVIPIMGACSQAGLGGRCLLRAAKKPRFVIPNNKLEEYRSYMKDHALICKFVGIWLSQKDMAKWIQQRWKPKEHIDLKLEAKGFLTVIFSNLEDRERIFEEGTYFLNNVDLFMRH